MGLMGVPDFKFASDLGDSVWIDSNRDGIRGINEHGLDGVRVSLYEITPHQNNYITFTVTGPTGHYLFPALMPGTYQLRFQLPAWMKFTTTEAYGGSYSPPELTPWDSNAFRDGFTRPITLNYRDNLTVDAGAVYKAGLSSSREPLLPSQAPPPRDLYYPTDGTETPSPSSALIGVLIIGAFLLSRMARVIPRS